MLLTEGDGLNYSSYTDSVDSVMTYVLMDSDSFDPSIDCLELNATGTIRCDFNNDGTLDVEGGANRGWLLLDGTGASDLSNIIRYGYPGPLTLPQWFPGSNGVAASVYDTVGDIRYNIALVPVFNAICEDYTGADLPTTCPEYVAGDLVKDGSGVGTYYRVPSFAAFVITCVSKTSGDRCPGKSYANIDHNVKTIEGYFINGYSAGTVIDPGGFDLGVYVVSLTK
jgi:hypothetical protein